MHVMRESGTYVVSFFQVCNPVSSQSMVPRRYLPTRYLIKWLAIGR
jgi:hypothetical protein